MVHVPFFIDGFPANGIPEVLGGVHFFRGVYSTGGHDDWPSFYSGSVTPCAIVAFSGFVTSSAQNEITWPVQANTTLYEIARADGPTFDTGCKRVTTPDTHAQQCC